MEASTDLIDLWHFRAALTRRQRVAFLICFVVANIRERLKMMCGGTLEITSRETGGTRVTIRVPFRNAE